MIGSRRSFSLDYATPNTTIERTMPEILHKTSDVRWLPTGDGEAYKVHHTFTVLRDGEMYFMRSEKYPYNWLSRLRYFLGAKPETTVALDPIDRKLAEVLSGRAI